MTSDRCWMVFTTGGASRSSSVCARRAHFALPRSGLRGLRVRHRQRRARSGLLETAASDGIFCPAGTSAMVASGSTAARDVGHNRPAISRRNLRCIVRHGAEAVGHHVEEISQRRFAQALDVIRRRARKPRARNHAVAVAHTRVAGRAINVEALAVPARSSSAVTGNGM